VPRVLADVREEVAHDGLVAFERLDEPVARGERRTGDAAPLVPRARPAEDRSELGFASIGRDLRLR